MRKHVAGPTCPGCEDRLVLAHPELIAWFQRMKAAHPDLHTSWTYRTQAEQTQCMADGETKIAWPNSKHNVDFCGIPRSDAIDVFQIASNGLACWVWSFFRTLSAETKAEGARIKWGGDFKTNGEDGDHFERIDP